MQKQALWTLKPQFMMNLQQRTFVKTIEDRKEDKEKKAFQDDIQYFLSKDTFTLHDFHERVIKGLSQKSSFKMLLWGDDVEFKVLESQNKICSAFSEDEKNEEKKLSKQDKQEIAEVAQLEINDINDVMQKHSQMKGFHKFLKARRQRNEPMPESREDLMMMYRIERPVFLMAKQNPFRRYAPKVSAQANYRKHT